MKTKNIWSVLLMLVLVLGASFAFTACGGDDDDKGGNTTGGDTTGGGGAAVGSIVGSYTAVTGEGYSVSVMFGDNGTGLITEKYQDSYSGGYGTETQEFKYTMAGENGFLNKVSDSYSSSKTYTIRIVEGFLLIEESDGDVELILYKNGQDLGKPDTKKIVGTWEYSDAGEKVSVTVNSNGTGTGTSEYVSGNYHEKESFNFTYIMKNSYIVDCTIRQEDSYSGSYTETLPVVVLNNKLYLCERDGEVDREQILTKK